MGQSLHPDALAEAINAALADFKDVVDEDVQKAVKSVSRAAKDRTANAAKQQFGGTGEYAGNWKVKYKATQNGADATVYNAKTYRLTHLLEHGHAKVNGGRVEGREHIGPAEQWAVNEFEKAIKEAIKQ